MKIRKILLLLTACLFFQGVALAQPASLYTIAGKVLDSQTKEPLPSATVQIENTTRGVVSDAEGRFVLDGIRASQVRLVISFVGYETYILNHDFSRDPDPFYTIELTPRSTAIQEALITGEARGQIKALIDQRIAVNIKSIVSAEQIAQFPDLNAAEAMQRIPGITLQRDQGEGRYVQLRGTPPELTNFNINGEQIPSPEGHVRFVGMDIISADQIETIEITKVLTPDMDADGIGGTVNIVTKKASGSDPEIRATASGGYNHLRQTGNANLQYSYGQRYGRFGFHLNSSYFRNVQGSDNMEFKYAKGPFWGSQDEGVDNYKVQYREVQLRHYDLTRTRTGLSATVDYEFNPGSFIYLRGMYNRFTDDERRYRKIYDCDDAVNDSYYLYGGIKHDVRDRIQLQNVNTLNFGGQHQVWGATLDYEVAWAQAGEEIPNYLEAVFDSPGQAIALKFDKEDPNWPRVIIPAERDSANALAYEKYELDDLLFEQHQVRDQNLTGKLNLTMPYRMGARSSGFVKLGAKVRLKNKERDIVASQYSAYRTTSRTYPGEGPDFYLADAAEDFADQNLLNRGYVMDYMPSVSKVRDFFEFYPQFFIYDRTDTKMQSFGEDYKAQEDIYAGYAMIKHDFNQLMLLGGVRFEQTDIRYEGRRVITDRGRFERLDTLTDSRTHAFLLPQFQMKYSIDETINLRAGLTYTYSRPNFEDVLPYREEDRKEVTYGNPDLIFPKSTNVDLLAEKYLRGGGLVSGGFFYKNIDHFIFYYKRFAHEGDPKDYGLVEITKAINGIEAFVYGAELQTQFKWSFLPGFLKDFGVFANYTFTHSEAFINKRYPANYSDAIVIFGDDDLSLFSSTEEQEQITLPGQARHTTNLALFYDSERFYAKISANYHDSFLYELGADSDLDAYYAAAWHLDFTANYKVTDYLRVFMDVVNLTNAPLKYYLGTPDVVLQQEYYSWWGRLGVKLFF